MPQRNERQPGHPPSPCRLSKLFLLFVIWFSQCPARHEITAKESGTEGWRDSPEAPTGWWGQGQLSWSEVLCWTLRRPGCLQCSLALLSSFIGDSHIKEGSERHQLDSFGARTSSLYHTAPSTSVNGVSWGCGHRLSLPTPSTLLEPLHAHSPSLSCGPGLPHSIQEGSRL